MLNADVDLLSIMYAKAYGIYFLVVGLALLFNSDCFRTWYEDILKENRRVVFGGTLSLLIGSFILATHHVLVLDWPLIITLIGYWGVGSGALCLISKNYIKLFKPMINASKTVYQLSGVAWSLLGVFLILQGF